MRNRWKSRKFILAAVTFAVNIIAIMGYNVDIDKAALVDSVVMLWLVIEGIIDARKAG